MKPAYRASWMCRKTLTAEIQSGTSNVSTSELSRYSLSEPQAARKTQRICPMEQYNLARRAALPPFDCCRVSLKKTDAHRHDRGGGALLYPPMAEIRFCTRVRCGFELKRKRNMQPAATPFLRGVREQVRGVFAGSEQSVHLVAAGELETERSGPGVEINGRHFSQ